MTEGGFGETAGWIFTTIALIGTILNSQMSIWGFVFWIVSNTGFLVINYLKHDYALVVLFLVNTIVAIIGIITWLKKIKK
jgi:nicotinamide riboside transporter PnuC